MDKKTDKSPHTWFQGERYNLSKNEEYVRDTFYDNKCENCKLSFKNSEGILICVKTINQTQPNNYCDKFKNKIK